MSGQEALQVLEKHLPDAILLDVMMPEMSGMEVLEVLQQKDETREIPILMVTAKAGPEDVEEALKKGAQDYIKKPINEIELLARLRTALRIKHQADTLRNMLRSKEEFIRIVAHDLRTPLSTISGFAEMILMNFSGDEPQSEEIKNYLQIIVETTNNISEYFNKLLTWPTWVPVGSNCPLKKYPFHGY
jgi:PleD family two-component response regulator